jgi:RNA polymerase sigma-70 factor (ECF subfamily)
MPTKLPGDDKALFLRIAEGDENAYRAVFDRYKAPFHSAAFKLTRQTSSAEDIVQEVFILLWTKRALVAAADNPTHYLFTILYNSIYAHFKKIAAESQLRQNLLLHTADPDDGIMEGLQQKDEQALLDTAIGQLPRQQQLVYKLSRQEGMSRGEIASRMHISPHSVKNHLQHAIRSIRGYFKDHPTISVVLLCWLKNFF